MKRIIAALVFLSLVPDVAHAQLKISDYRPAYSVPPGAHGPTRVDAAHSKLLAADDVLYAEFTIEGLATEPQTGKVRYDTMLEIFDAKGKRISERKTVNETVPQLSGRRMPGSLFVRVGQAFVPGNYTMQLTVKDVISGKPDVVLRKPFAVIPMTFSFIRVKALAVDVPDVPVGLQCSIVGFALDNKKLPKVDVTVRVLDSDGKPASNPAEMNFPAALPPGINPQGITELPVIYPLTPNRPGRFFIEVVAIDRNAKNAKIELKLPLVVLDVGQVLSGK